MLNLDEDINRYLKSAQVSGPKVTLRMLLKHSGGFDDNLTGLFAPFDGDIHIPTAELNRRFHPLVPPGYVAAYDNQGYGVIGVVLRDVTGKSIPDLYRERLFQPAGMKNAAHGRPADGKARLAHCYVVHGPGAVEECEYWLYRDGLMGAGGVAMSGTDMAQYMRLLLNHGTLDGRVVISPAAFADVTDFSHFRFHPGMPGGGHAFIQFEERRGLEYAHSGHMPGFSTMMKIYDEANVGIFTSFTGGEIRSYDFTLGNAFHALKDSDIQPAAMPGLNTLRTLDEAFAKQFIPADKPRSSEGKAIDGVDRNGNVEDFLGTYVLTTAHSDNFAVRVGGWLGTMSVESAGPDSVRFTGGLAALGVYKKVGPLLFENEKGDRLAFGALPIGKFMAVGLSGGMLRKTNAFETPGTWSMLLLVFSTIFILTAVFQLRAKAGDRVRRLAQSTLLGYVLVLAALLIEWQWGVALAVMRGSILLPALWRLALHVGVVLLVWAAIRFFRDRTPTTGKVRYTHAALIAASALGVAVVMLAWRVLFAFPPYFSW